MSEVSGIVGRVHAMQTGIATSLDQFGGFLRCEDCHRCLPLNKGDAGYYTAHGWPRCCDLTMRWWTQRQIDAGEVPAPAAVGGETT